MVKRRIKVDMDNKCLTLPRKSVYVQGFAEQVEKTRQGYVYCFRFKTDLKQALQVLKKRRRR